MELVASAADKTARALLRIAIVTYQGTVSPLLGKHCRFYPSCSQYVLTAVDRHGLLKGLFLGVRRLMRCNGFFPGGYDPVPGDSALTHASQHGAQFNVFPKG
jgi:putative membrane protein insertion efficiency factor